VATRLLTTPAGTDRLSQAFRLAMGREIKASERPSLEKLISDQTAYYQNNPADATKLLKVGFSPMPTGEPAELAAWTNLCRVVLNSHEAITRY